MMIENEATSTTDEGAPHDDCHAHSRLPPDQAGPSPTAARDGSAGESSAGTGGSEEEDPFTPRERQRLFEIMEKSLDAHREYAFGLHENFRREVDDRLDRELGEIRQRLDEVEAKPFRKEVRQ